MKWTLGCSGCLTHERADVGQMSHHVYSWTHFVIIQICRGYASGVAPGAGSRTQLQTAAGSTFRPIIPAVLRSFRLVPLLSSSFLIVTGPARAWRAWQCTIRTSTETKTKELVNAEQLNILAEYFTWLTTRRLPVLLSTYASIFISLSSSSDSILVSNLRLSIPNSVTALYSAVKLSPNPNLSLSLSASCLFIDNNNALSTSQHHHSVY